MRKLVRFVKIFDTPKKKDVVIMKNFLALIGKKSFSNIKKIITHEKKLASNRKKNILVL